MIARLAGRGQLGRLARASYPLGTGTVVLLDDRFNGVGTMAGRVPDTVGAAAWVVVSGDWQTNDAMAFAYAAGTAMYDLGGMARLIRWRLIVDGSNDDRLFTYGWSSSDQTGWVFGYNRASTNRTSIVDWASGTAVVVAASAGPNLPPGGYICEAVVSGSTVTYRLAIGTSYQRTLAWGSFDPKGTKVGLWASISTLAKRGWDSIYAEAP